MRPVLCPACFVKPELHFKELVVQRSLEVWKGLQTKGNQFHSQLFTWFHQLHSLQKNVRKHLHVMQKKTNSMFFSLRLKLMEMIQ